ncbi:MAG TPA: hypothetical protein VNK52_07910 [Hyphomicrobiaceae bacterium]|nr:hypothetical protein [Hyphomicrobiaceae bacterium]
MGPRTSQVDKDEVRLLGSLEEEDDPRKAYAKLQDRIRAYRRTGKAVPEPLAVAERQLMTEMMAQSQGR